MSCPQDKKTFCEWFVSSSFRELELLREGTSNACSHWIPAVCAWFFERLPQSRKNHFIDQLSEVRKAKYGEIRETKARICENCVPFPGVLKKSTAAPMGPCVDSGQIAFIGVSSSKNSNFIDAADGGAHGLALNAAKYVYDVFRRFDRDVGYPEIHLYSSETLAGDSLTLSAMIAALCSILEMEIPDDLIATGALRKNPEGIYTLQPVESATLAQKICAAIRYGYRKFLFVQGQEGCWQNRKCSLEQLYDALKREKVLPEDAVLELIPVPESPLHALWEILKHLGGQNDSNEKKLAMFLAVLGYQPFRNDPQFYEILRTHSKSKSKLVRHIALDLRRRIDVDSGKAHECDYLEEIPQLEPEDFPLGPLGSYLKYEEPSTYVVMDLDNGIWSEDEPNCKRTLEVLQWQEKCIEMRIADIEDIRVAMCLSNHVARHHLFHGKLRQDADLIVQAWNRLIRFREYWPGIFRHAKEQGHKMETIQWQRNLCIECLESYWNLTQKTLEPFPEAFELSEDMNGYDLTAWLRWMVMRHGREISDADIGRCLELTDKIYENPRVEDYKPYEKILQYELGTSEQQAHARKQLERAGHITELQAGIMGILAMRTAYILRDYAKLEAVRGKVHVSLQWLADELAKEPEKIPFRCPY